MLAIDLRDIGWTERHWSYLLEAGYPYGLQRGDDIAQRVYELTDCALPYLRADWFVGHAARPPLYHQLLALPEHVATLEHQLGVDRKLNFDKDQLHRAGFRKSGVSGQNRVVERHDAKHGAYWISDDFLTQTDRGDIFRFPLGPEFPGSKGLAAYKHDGGEIIFNLPNGLQAYLLAKSSGERINEGPVKIVNDPNQFSGTFEIVNGISCMGCHKHGMIPFEDTVRATFNKQGGQAVADKVQRIYSEPAVINRLVEEDRVRFLTALEKAVGSSLKVGPDAAKPITDFPDSVTLVARHYDRQLKLADVARELGLPESPEVANKLGVPSAGELGTAIKVSDGLRRANLTPLATGETIPRGTWEKSFGRAARELKLGLPLGF